MKGDFSRDTFNPEKHYSRVLMQQGRALLDSDWNEMLSILLEQHRMLARDIYGPHGGPEANAGFRITKDATGWKIGEGRYYVDGMMCDNTNSSVALTPDQIETAKSAAVNMPVLVFLDVWERHITSIEDPHIREIALGGAETSTRAQLVSQVHLQKVSSSLVPVLTIREMDKRMENWGKWVTENLKQTRAKMSAKLHRPQSSSTPCSIPATSSYRGLENQLYRVEVHQGTNLESKPVTIKWSRENGSVVTAWLESQGKRLTVAHTRGFEVGNWVELLDDRHELERLPGQLVKIVRVDADAIVIAQDFDETKFGDTKKIRRWDHKEIEIPPINSDPSKNWIDLEAGIQIQFENLTDQFNTGDYWLIPARVANGEIEWPMKRKSDGSLATDPDGQPIPKLIEPHGVEHHYAPLALIETSTSDPKDLRRQLELKFTP
jgi:Family of unknown function (DUF6519)